MIGNFTFYPRWPAMTAMLRTLGRYPLSLAHYPLFLGPSTPPNFSDLCTSPCEMTSTLNQNKPRFQHTTETKRSLLISLWPLTMFSSLQPRRPQVRNILEQFSFQAMADIASQGPATKITTFHSASTGPRGASPATTLYNFSVASTTSELAQLLLLLLLLVIIRLSQSTTQTNPANRRYATHPISPFLHSKSTSYPSSSILAKITILRPFDASSRLFHTESKETTVSDTRPRF